MSNITRPPIKVSLQTLANRGQNDVADRLLAAADRNAHGDAIGQRQASADQHVVTSPEHT